MLTVATLLWAPNDKSLPFSRMYDETWVERLFRGFRRNLTVPFRFVVFTDLAYSFDEPDIESHALRDPNPSYSTCIEPYGLNEPMILVGLDTIVTGNCDHLAEYCLTSDVIALPRDPYMKQRACNGVALVPRGNAHVYTRHNGENDMDWMRAQPHMFIDDAWPGHVVSYKGDVKGRSLGDARIVYFHGEDKPHQINDPWVKEHWR